MYEHSTWIARRNGAFTMNTVTNAMRAHILTAAVPYIKQYTDQYGVVKYGGNAMIDEELKKSVMKDLMLLQLVGVKVVLVQDVYKRQPCYTSW